VIKNLQLRINLIWRHFVGKPGQKYKRAVQSANSDVVYIRLGPQHFNGTPRYFTRYYVKFKGAREACGSFPKCTPREGTEGLLKSEQLTRKRRTSIKLFCITFTLDARVSPRSLITLMRVAYRAVAVSPRLLRISSYLPLYKRQNPRNIEGKHPSRSRCGAFVYP